MGLYETMKVGIFCLWFGIGLMLEVVSSSKFDELFKPTWALDHFIYEGESLKLKLDNFSGAGFQSKSKYLYGKVTVQIKLVEGDSAGTVTAYYMSSEGPTHNEFDFEFLGNTTGEPYVVQTNIYVNGEGNREQRLNLWFDPTKDFHNYSLLWTPRKVVFMVDETPIREHTNLEHKGIPYPKDQAMGVYSSIWNADDWATQGGRVKTDWSHAPFIASYKGFEIHACECPGVPTTATADIMKRFMVDETPIREHTNLEHKGIPYPKDQAMGVYSSIWNADDWATQGGRVKTDWSHAPFIASYKGFEIHACECPGVPTTATADIMKRCSSYSNSTSTSTTSSELTIHQSHQLMWVKANHLIYDYCTDTTRFPTIPAECVHHRHPSPHQ